MKTVTRKKPLFIELQNVFGKEGVIRDSGGQKDAFLFNIDVIAQRYGAKDNAAPGYRHQFDFDIAIPLEKELKSLGYEVINIWVGSWVHGWIHRLVRKM